jgi:hypothetical protein
MIARSRWSFSKNICASTTDLRCSADRLEQRAKKWTPVIRLRGPSVRENAAKTKESRDDCDSTESQSSLDLQIKAGANRNRLWIQDVFCERPEPAFRKSLGRHKKKRGLKAAFLFAHLLANLTPRQNANQGFVWKR